MSDTFYNPCEDGFVAKFWECLRRNPEFRDACNYFGAHDEESATDSVNYIFANYVSRPAYRVIFGHALGYDPELPGHHWNSWLSPQHTWPELGEEVRNAIENEFIEFLPYKLDLLEQKTIYDILISRKALIDSSLRNMLVEIESSLQNYEIITLPKAVMTPSHKKEILKGIDEMIGEPITKTALLKPSGRTLGSHREWATFLLVEFWQKNGYGRGKACSLAAWEFYGHETFGSTAEERSLGAEEFLKNCPKEHSQLATIEGFVVKIERAIESVFPEHNPLESPQ